MTVRISISLLLFAFSQFIFAQHEHDSEIHETNHGKHKISLYTGFTHVSAAFYEHETHEQSTGKWIPTIGIDYYYTLNTKWDLGFIGDVEIDEYYIRTNEHNELERNNIMVLSLVGKYKPIKRLGIFAGPGYETEYKRRHTKSFFVAKIGVEYEVEIENGWELTPVLSYDLKEEYSSYALGITLGKRF